MVHFVVFFVLICFDSFVSNVKRIYKDPFTQKDRISRNLCVAWFVVFIVIGGFLDPKIESIMFIFIFDKKCSKWIRWVGDPQDTYALCATTTTIPKDSIASNTLRQRCPCTYTDIVYPAAAAAVSTLNKHCSVCVLLVGMCECAYIPFKKWS